MLFLFLSSIFGPPLAAYFVLRQGGRTVTGALLGALYLWAACMGIVFVVVIGMIPFGADHEWTFGLAALAIAAFLFWGVRRHLPRR